MKHATLKLFPLLPLLILVSACQSASGPGDRVIATLDELSALPSRAEAPVPMEVAEALVPLLDPVFEDYDPSAERFDISVTDLPPREFFQTLVRDTPFNVVVHPEIAGNVTLSLKNVTLDEILSLTRDLYGFEFEREGLLYRILPGGLRTEIFKVSYLNMSRTGGSEIQVSAGQVSNARSGNSQNQQSSNNSQDNNRDQQGSAQGVTGTHISTRSESNFWSQLQFTLDTIVGSGEGRAVVTSPESGMIVVRAMPAELRTVEDYLERSELIMQRQVILEAKILEVRLNEGFRQGISWSDIAELNDDLNPDGSPQKVASFGLAGDPISNPGLEGVFSTALQFRDFDALIQLLSSQGSVQVLSSPRIATVNNQKAVIKVGSDEFLVTEIRVDQNNNVNSNNTTNTDVELTPFFSGIALDVTPQIGEDGRVILHVHPSISEVTDQTKVVSLGDRDLTLPLARSTIRETDSVISAYSGQVVVIGGLISDTSQIDRVGVPVLGRLPVVGNAFSQKSETKTKSELVILIRPIIASPENMRQDIADTRSRFTQLRGGE